MSTIDEPVMSNPEMRFNDKGHAHFHNPGEQEGLTLIPVSYCEKFPDVCFDFKQSSWIGQLLFGDDKNKNSGNATVKKDFTIVGQKRQMTGWKQPMFTTKSEDGTYHLEGGRVEKYVTVVLPPGMNVNVERPHTSEGRFTIRAGSYYYDDGCNHYNVHNSKYPNEIIF